MDKKEAILRIKEHIEHHKIGEYPHLKLKEALDMAISVLTQPNELPPCYQPDGDGCAYQCYDGDDEPIDKCKECPLCYSDKPRHRTPPNEWVSVKDRLPTLPGYDYCSVMVNTAYKNNPESCPMIYERSVVRGKRVERWKYYWDRIADEPPDYWMPLPEPPNRRPPEGEA